MSKNYDDQCLGIWEGRGRPKISDTFGGSGTILNLDRFQKNRKRGWRNLGKIFEILRYFDNDKTEIDPTKLKESKIFDMF